MLLAVRVGNCTVARVIYQDAKSPVHRSFWVPCTLFPPPFLKKLRLKTKTKTKTKQCKVFTDIAGTTGKRIELKIIPDI